jgi:quercetin 2,3-dioxygenase
VSGEVNGVKRPVRDIFVEPEYFSVELVPGAEFKHLTKRGHTIFAYVFECSGYFDSGKGQRIGKENLVIYDDGEFSENNNSRASYPVLARLR